MIRLRTAEDEGTSLVEMLVTIVLMSVVSLLVVGAVVQSQRIYTQTDDENRGLQDAKIVLDRLGKDARQGRGVVCDGGLSDPTDPTSTDPYCQSHLQLWVDSNSDYIKQDSEVITWRLEKSTTSEHYNVVRSTGTTAGATAAKIEATSLYTRFAFKYDAVDSAGNPVFAKVQQINMELQYDALVGVGTKLRYAAFSARLRNKGL